MGNLNLNLSHVDTSSNQGDRSPLPEGVYVVKAVEAELRDNKAGTGKYIAFTFDVMEGQYAGRKVWMNLTIMHETSRMAVEIGEKTLKQYAEAIGHANPNEIGGTNELLNGRNVKAKVVIKSDAQYGDKNEIKFFNPISTGQKVAVAAAPAPAKGRALNPFAD